MLAVTFRRQVAVYLTCLEEYFIDRMSLFSVLHRIAASLLDRACTLLNTVSNVNLRCASARSLRAQLLRGVSSVELVLPGNLLANRISGDVSPAQPRTANSLNLQNGRSRSHQYTQPALVAGFFRSVPPAVSGWIYRRSIPWHARIAAQTISEHTHVSRNFNSGELTDTELLHCRC